MPVRCGSRDAADMTQFLIRNGWIQILLVLMLIGCAVPEKKRAVLMPPSPMGISKAVTKAVAKAYEIPLVAFTNWVVWDYVYDTNPNDIVFVVRRGDLKSTVWNWPIIGVTQDHNFEMAGVNKKLYVVAVTASNTLAGIENRINGKTK